MRIADRRRTGLTLAVVAAVLATSLTVATESRADSTTVVFGSFESAGSVGSVTPNHPDVDQVSWSSDVVSQGAHSLEFDVAGGNAPTPQISLRAGSAFDAASWVGQKIITWDVMSDSPVQFLGQVTIKDTAGHAYGHGYYIPAYGYHAYDAYVADVAKAGVDVAHISEVDLSLPRQQWPVRMFIDTFRLIDTWPYDHTPYQNAATPGLISVMDLDGSIAHAQATLRDVRRRIRPTHTAADRALATRAAGLAADVSALADRAGRPGLTLPDAQALRADIATATQRIQRLGQVVDARRTEPDSPDYATLFADSMSLVYPADRPCTCRAGTLPLGLARGEYQSEQVAVIPYAADLTGLRVQVAGVHGPHTHGAPVTATVAPVGFLNTTPTDAYHATRDGTPWYTGWTPDPIRDDLNTIDVPQDRFQPYWVTVHAARDAAPGRYTVTLVIAADQVRRRTVTIPVEVWPVTVPDRPALTTSFDFRPTLVTPLYGDTDPAAVTARIHQYETFLEDYKIEPDSIYAATPPTVEDLEWVQSRWGLRHFNVLYLNKNLFDLSKPSSWQAQIDSWLDTIGRAMVKYRAAGLDKLAYVYGFDEATAAYLPAVRMTLTQLKQRFPDLPVISTLRDNTMGPGSGLTGLVDIWSPQMDLYQSAPAAQAHARGDHVYWYPDIATGHPYPNWFNGYPPIDTRMMMGPMSHQAGVDGVLYYAVNRWIDHPLLDDGIYSGWNPATLDTTAGDGSLFYPGAHGPLASIRLANLRDGMQDYNLLELLRQRIASAKHTSPAELARARELLAATAVVHNDTSYTEDPALYRHWRAEVAEEIGKLTRR